MKKVWCATKGNIEHKAGGWETPTLCGMHVTLNFGIEKRVPNCGDCRNLLEKTPKRKVAAKC
jgi:hypothetical protein